MGFDLEENQYSSMHNAFIVSSNIGSLPIPDAAFATDTANR